MSVNLQKGQKVDLTKGNAGLSKLMVGLGWDAAVPEKRGFFFKSQVNAEIDCDASVLMCDENDKVRDKTDIVYFGNLKHKSQAVTHLGDNLTGDGDGDDEQILVDLSKIPGNYQKLVFVVNIYQAQQRKQHFGMIKNAYIRIVNGDNNAELAKFNLSDNYQDMTAMIMGEVYRHQGEWKFSAIGQATKDGSLQEVLGRYR